MYKVIYNDFIVDAIKDIKYLRYIGRTGKVTVSDPSSCNAIYSSDRKTIYMLQGKKIPEACPHKIVKLQKITESEYERLSKQLKANEKLYANLSDLNKVRNEKIAELSKQCNNTIINGVNVLMSDGLYHHFKLTLEDQLNISMLEKQVNSGYTTVLYHETNKLSKIYSAEDIAKLFVESDKHKQYHTTYFNILKHFINCCYDVYKIRNIEYGVDLSSIGVSKELISLLER